MASYQCLRIAGRWRSGADAVRLVCFAFAAAGLQMLGGCGPGNVAEARDIAEVQRIVNESNRPVLVDFYKAGCKNCSAFEITLGALAEEYKGRISVFKFLLKRANGDCTAPDFAEQHEILVYPTVVFYVNGQEKKRLEQQYKYDDYNVAINECLVAPTASQAATQSATTTSATRPATTQATPNSRSMGEEQNSR